MSPANCRILTSSSSDVSARWLHSRTPLAEIYFLASGFCCPISIETNTSMCDVWSILKGHPVEDTAAIWRNSRLAGAHLKPTCSNRLNPQSWWWVNIWKLLAMTQGNMNVNLEVYLKKDCVSCCIKSRNHNVNTIGDVTNDLQTACRHRAANENFIRHQKKKAIFQNFKIKKNMIVILYL